MNNYVKVPLLSCALGIVLLLASFAVSGSYASQWNGQPCVAGTQYGFPLPFMYSMNRQTLTPPQTHSTLVCPTTANIVPLKTDVPKLILDYLFWFVVSLLVVFVVIEALSRKKSENVTKQREVSPAYGVEPPLPMDP
jgi:hypothetical protein